MGNSNFNTNDKVPSQRQTTLKWNENGELTSIDMARVLQGLSKPELTQCDLPDEQKEKKLN